MFLSVISVVLSFNTLLKLPRGLVITHTATDYSLGEYRFQAVGNLMCHCFLLSGFQVSLFFSFFIPPAYTDTSHSVIHPVCMHVCVSRVCVHNGVSY